MPGRRKSAPLANRSAEPNPAKRNKTSWPPQSTLRRSSPPARNSAKASRSAPSASSDRTSPSATMSASCRTSRSPATRQSERVPSFPFTALGEPPQDLKFKGEDTHLRVGADNVIREHVTFHLGTAQGRGETVIGDRNFFMTGSHVGHDCIVGNNIVFANNAILGAAGRRGRFRHARRPQRSSSTWSRRTLCVHRRRRAGDWRRHSVWHGR